MIGHHRAPSIWTLDSSLLCLSADKDFHARASSAVQVAEQRQAVTAEGKLYNSAAGVIQLYRYPGLTPSAANTLLHKVNM